MKYLWVHANRDKQTTGEGAALPYKRILLINVKGTRKREDRCCNTKVVTVTNKTHWRTQKQSAKV